MSEVRARLSQYLARVRGGEEVVVTDRGRPIARIVPASQAEGRVAELERTGMIKPPAGALAPDFLAQERPVLSSDASLLAAVVEERRDGR